VYAHIYLTHMNEINDLQENAHLNTSFKHFIYFSDEFKLIPIKEQGPLSFLIEEMKQVNKDNNQ